MTATRDDDETYNETCPWCGHQQSDLWEHREDDTEDECASCGKPIRIIREVSVDYTIQKVTQ